MPARNNQAMTLTEAQEFFAEAFPHSSTVVEQVGDRRARLRRPVKSQDLRPGDTVSGPTMMMIADAALYIAILGEIGLVPQAVTTNLNINFLRRPAPDKDVVGECKLIKVGRTLAVGEVTIFSDGHDDPIAHATGTYSIPPEAR